MHNRKQRRGRTDETLHALANSLAVMRSNIELALLDEHRLGPEIVSLLRLQLAEIDKMAVLMREKETDQERAS